MISYKLASDQLRDHCAKYGKDCDYLKDVYHWSFWINFAFTTVISTYFAFVCKLYADQALPSIRTHHDSIHMARNSIKSYAPTGQTTYVQHGIAKPVDDSIVYRPVQQYQGPEYQGPAVTAAEHMHNFKPGESSQYGNYSIDASRKEQSNFSREIYK